MSELNFESLDVPDTEILNAPESTPEAAPPVPIVETAERARDPSTGQFVAQAPAPDPIAAATPPAPAAPAAPVPVAPVPEPRVIPLAAHLEERSRWKQENAELARRLEEVNARIGKLEAPAQPDPEFVEDPKGYVDAQAAKTAKQLEELRAEATNIQNQQRFGQFMNEVSNKEADFVRKNPDYYDALGHVRALRTEQLRDLYPEATAEQIQQTISQEELTVAAQLLQIGKNPAESVYKTAKIYGYKPKDAAPPAPAAAAPNIPKAPVADPGSTLGSSGGPGDPDEVTDEQDFTAEAAATQALRERFGARR